MVADPAHPNEYAKVTDPLLERRAPDPLESLRAKLENEESLFEVLHLVYDDPE